MLRNKEKTGAKDCRVGVGGVTSQVSDKWAEAGTGYLRECGGGCVPCEVCEVMVCGCGGMQLNMQLLQLLFSFFSMYLRAFQESKVEEERKEAEVNESGEEKINLEPPRPGRE